MGSVPAEAEGCSSQEIVSLLARRTGGAARFFSVPLLVEGRASREALLQDRWNQTVRGLQQFCDGVLLHIASMAECAAEGYLGYMDRSYFQEAQAAGAVGAVCGRFFDREGREVPCRWNRRCTGVSVESLRRTELSLYVYDQREKTEPLLHALRSGMIHTLITGGTTAAALLRLA